MGSRRTRGQQAQQWEAIWLGRFRQFLRDHDLPLSSLDRETVIAFSRSLVQRQTPTWQRLQALRAIRQDARRHGIDTPQLTDIEEKLHEMASAERQPGGECARLCFLFLGAS